MSKTAPRGIRPALQERSAALSDEQIAARVRAGDAALYEVLMRRHNQRLYRAVRAILRDDVEVEDVLQDTYLAAYRNLGEFEGRSRLSTWLTRIAVNRAIDRRRRRAPLVSLDPRRELVAEQAPAWIAPPRETPEGQSARREVAHLIENAIDALPDGFRGVYVLRDVEGLGTDETAEILELDRGTVRTRLHRARMLLRDRLARDLGDGVVEAFPFGADRCDRLVERALVRVAAEADENRPDAPGSLRGPTTGGGGSAA